jgi:HlyD family type I secretion membrane fusion protein
VSTALSKIQDRFNAPVKAALRALTSPTDLTEDAILVGQDVAVAGHDPLKRRMHRPMIIGAAVVLVFIVLAGIWASFVKINGAVSAPGQVRAEFSRRTLRQRDGGVVSALYVHEGDLVKAGQPLIQFAPTQPKAAVDVMRNQVDSTTAQAARYEAEMTGKSAIAFPADMIERAKTDPAVAALMRDQQLVFDSRRALMNDQRSVYKQQIEQLKARIGGLNLQIAANEQSAALIREQLKSYQTLYEKGYASRTTVLNLQRTLSDMGGQKGANIAQVTTTQEQIGEVTVNLAKLTQQAQAEAAEGLRDSQVRLADALPRLRAAEESLEGATVRSPIDGYVLGLTQFTVGAAAGSGERLMDIVPANEPLIIESHIKPTDIDDAKVGQKARVMFSAYNSRTHPGVDGTVIGVSADLIETEKGGYFRVDVRVDPKDLASAGEKDVKLTPGMPATVMLLTGKRSIMSYLVGPFVAPISKAFRED